MTAGGEEEEKGGGEEGGGRTKKEQVFIMRQRSAETVSGRRKTNRYAEDMSEFAAGFGRSSRQMKKSYASWKIGVNRWIKGDSEKLVCKLKDTTSFRRKCLNRRAGKQKQIKRH